MRQILSDPEGVFGSPSRNLIAILAFVATVAVAATIAYLAAGWSLGDAVYMVLITIYTVGYNEVRPIDTPYLHIVTMVTMVLGCTGMILLTGALVQLFTFSQLRAFLGANRMNSKIARMKNHVIVCGYGRIGMMLAVELQRAGTDFVVIERGPERLAEAEAAGFATVSGDATEEDVLLDAGIDRARALATVLPDDAANVFITLSARNLNDKLEIIARGEAMTTESKLVRAGADHVIFPTHIGAETIARMILFPKEAGITSDPKLAKLRRELQVVGLELERHDVTAASPLCGLSIAEAEQRVAGGLFIVQIDRAEGHCLPCPSRDERIARGDRLLLVLRDAATAASALGRPAGHARRA